MNYQDAGVDIEKANNFIAANLPRIHNTYDRNVITNKNNFAGLYDLSNLRYKHPVLAVSCDGIGSKIKLAIKHNSYYNLGLDLIANNVNDILCSGADPLMFLDYYAVGNLNPEIANQIMQGLVDGCLWSGISLIGGETAELPLTYRDDDFDLVGTAIGIVDREHIFDPKNIKSGDILIGIKSSGVHSNGYSLINKILSGKNIPWEVAHDLLEPTKNYTSIIRHLKANVNLLGCANITGGGLVDNIPRILPDNLSAFINLRYYDRPDIFYWIQVNGKVDESEMRKVYNLGIGMVICVDEEDASSAMEILGTDGIDLGFVVQKTNSDSVIFS